MKTTRLDISESTLGAILGSKSEAADLMAELEAYDAECKANKKPTPPTTPAPNLFAIPEDDDAPELSPLMQAIQEELDYTVLEADLAAANALGITPLADNASPFEIKHSQRKEQASGFNADLWLVLEPLLQDRKALALAAILRQKLSLEPTVIAEETRGFSPISITTAHAILAILVQRTMKPVQVAEILWSLPQCSNLDGDSLRAAKEAIEPLLLHLVETKQLDKIPALRGQSPTYALTRRLELARLAADALPVSGIILFLDEDGEVFPSPTKEDIAEGRAIPEIVLDEEDGFVRCTNTGTKLPCGLSRWLSVPFITPDHETIEELYAEYRAGVEADLLDAAGDEERLKELQDIREPSYWDVLRHYPSHACTTLVAKDDRGRLLIQADVGQHMTKEIRQHLTFLDGSSMSSADGKAFMLSLTGAIIGDCNEAIAAQLNLAPRADGKSLPELLKEARDRDYAGSIIRGMDFEELASWGVKNLPTDKHEEFNDLLLNSPTLKEPQDCLINALYPATAGDRDTARAFLRYCTCWEDVLKEFRCNPLLYSRIDTTQTFTPETALRQLLPATAGHRDPYAAVWLSFTKTLRRNIGATGKDPREVVKKGSTPAGYGSGQTNVARILKRDYGFSRDLGLETAKEIANFPPLKSALAIMRKALTPCASFTGHVKFDYNWTDEHGDEHTFHCETSTVIDNNYVGREWRYNDVLVLRTGESNLSKARTALLANLNQGIEAWLLECQAQFAGHLGIELWSTHDQTSTNSEYNTRLVTSISATALNAILAQNLAGMAKTWGLKLPARKHKPYDPMTPFYVFDNEDVK
jgi:hypothetical protein